MYSAIRSRETFPQQYIQQLLDKNVVSKDKIAKLQSQLEGYLTHEFESLKTYTVTSLNAFEGKWKEMHQPSLEQMNEKGQTGVDPKILIHVAKKSVEIPPNVDVHERLKRTHIQARLKQLNGDLDSIKVDWATAEAMAFGSLLLDKYNVRLAGQDCKRGTFSQRHAALTDQKNETRYTPLAHLDKEAGRFDVINSNLSELAVMAFEYGYSWENPKSLVMWEAQFGDFNNGAQIVIDQFLSSGESKWMRQSGLVLLLPHGYDGAGPDHSSGKLERFLQLIDTPALDSDRNSSDTQQYLVDVNMSVMNLTTPANYFHALRRQQLRSFRKPLVIMSPKTLLRSPDAQSLLTEMGPNSTFQSVMPDTVIVDAKQVKRVLFCSGKFYFDLAKHRDTKKDHSTAILRLEELSPFPFVKIQQQLSLYDSAKEFLWVQEEPLNQGAWTYMKPHLEKCLESNQSVRVVSRPSLPASAMGLSKISATQHQDLLQTIFP